MTKSWGKHFNENRDNEQEQWLPNQPNNITEQSPTVRIWWYGLLPDSLARHTSLNLPTNLPAFWPTHPPRPLPMYQLMYQSKEGNREKEGCTLHLSQWRNKIWTKEQESLRKAHVVWNEPMPGQTDRQTDSQLDRFSYPCLAGISAECTFQICLSCHSSESEHFQKLPTKDSPNGQVINSNKIKTCPSKL